MEYRQMIRCLFCLMMALMLLLPAALAESSPTEPYYEQVEVQKGTVVKDSRINVRREPDTSSERLGRLSPGESCVITGESGDWWQVDFKGKTGYVRKDLLEVSTVIEQVLVIVEAPLQAQLTDMELPTLLQYRNDYKLNGLICGNIPLVEVSVEIYNLRTLSVDRSISKSFAWEEKVTEFDLSRLAGEISFHRLDPGEKQLIVRIRSTNESATLLSAFFYIHTDSRAYTEPLHMTDSCQLSLPRGKKADLTDNKCSTCVALRSADEAIGISLPENRTPEGLALRWKYAPDRVKIELLDTSGLTLQTIEEQNPDRMIHFYYEIDERTAQILISAAGEEKLCEVRLYEKGFVPTVVQQWQPLPDKLDMLVISAHQDDELLFFGGTIPYYVAQGKKVGVVYMANCGRRRYGEALDGLWSCGLKYHPIFVGLEDARLDSYDQTVSLWGMENTENQLIELIRKYQPEVIVTHDVNGEYGHNQHKLTSAAVRNAVTRAGDASVHPVSAQTYGAWTPKKLYIHLYEENALTMEVYDQPVESLGNMTTTQIATIGYSKHVSQHDYFTMERHGVRYDNRKYGLAFTTVGPDVEKNDFFENIT